MSALQKVNACLVCETKDCLVYCVSVLVIYPFCSHAGSGRFNEKSLDQICVENIAKFRRQNIGQRNQSSLSHLLASFFEKVIEHIVHYIHQVIFARD
jgi:hypothetical protein